MRSISRKAFIPLIEFQKEKKDRRCTFWLRITTLPSRIRDSITLALPGRNWPFLFVRRSRAPPWEVNIPVASIPTFKAFPADIDRRDTVFRDTLSYFFYGPRLAPWYHSRTPFTTYRTAKETQGEATVYLDRWYRYREPEKSMLVWKFICRMEDWNGLICMFVRRGIFSVQ